MHMNLIKINFTWYFRQHILRIFTNYLINIALDEGSVPSPHNQLGELLLTNILVVIWRHYGVIWQ